MIWINYNGYFDELKKQVEENCSCFSGGKARTAQSSLDKGVIHSAVIIPVVGAVLESNINIFAMHCGDIGME